VLSVRFNLQTHERSLDVLRWGLVPHWAKDLVFGSRCINARAETAWKAVRRHVILAGLTAVVACTGPEDLTQPLSASMIRSQLPGRSFTGLLGNQRFFITFDRNGTATYYGDQTEYVHWRASDEGLCIRWFSAPNEKCAPVYLMGYQSYRVGSITIREFPLPRRF
jgi:hypothetical protein